MRRIDKRHAERFFDEPGHLDARLRASGFEFQLAESGALCPGVTYSEVASDAGFASGVTPNAWWLSISRSTVHAHFKTEEAGSHSVLAHAGQMHLMKPSGAYELEVDSAYQQSSLLIDNRLILQGLPEGYDGQRPFEGLSSTKLFRSQLIIALIGQLKQDALIGCLEGTFYAETLVAALVAEVARIAEDSAAGAVRPGRASDFSKRQLRQIDDYVDAHSFRAIKTSELAEIVGMHPSGFQKSFKVVMGMTPFQYVIGRRIYKAQQLIGGTQLSLAQIAFECGFSSQSHMTDTFRARLGATPGALR